jgi:hypothetical protein
MSLDEIDPVDRCREPTSAVPDAGTPESRLHRWWRGRLGVTLAREVATIAALLLLYRLGRYLGRDQVSEAFSNSREVLHVERWLGIANEQVLQRAVLDHVGVIKALNRYYATVHFPTTIAFLVVIYLRAGDVYTHIRRVFVVVTAAGLVIHIAYPLAPPRMMHGFVDTIARFGPAIYSKPGVASVANQHAAMPSLHFGWAVIVAYGTVISFRTRWRWLAVLHPVLTLAAIVLTANHYWMDALVALVLVAAAVAISRRARSDQAPTPAWSSP